MYRFSSTVLGGSWDLETGSEIVEKIRVSLQSNDSCKGSLSLVSKQKNGKR